jgi:hypothetical protein
MPEKLMHGVSGILFAHFFALKGFNIGISVPE